jgi:ferric-dicitrate binding protein FerR (iron transport regulator)
MTAQRDSIGDLVRAVGRRPQPSQEEYDRVLSVATSAWRAKHASVRRRRWLLAAAAMLVTAVTGLATLVHWMPRRAPSPVASVTVIHGNIAVMRPGDDTWRPLQLGNEVPQGARIRTGSHGGLALLLNRKQSVRIDQQSELALLSSGNLRLSTGAVYVDSGAQNDVVSVSVETDFGVVRDIGTIFEVRSTPDALRIRVREGEVRLDSPTRAAPVAGVAGEELAIDNHGRLARRTLRSSDPAWRWAEALATASDVNGRPLLQFLSWVARETGRQLQFQEPDVEVLARDVILHGTVRDLAPMDALDLMLSTTDLEYVLPNESVIVIRRRQM